MKKIKLHLGCGDVYLKDYINVDGTGELADKRPDLVEANQTSLKKYYRKPYLKQPLGHRHRREVVVDLKTDVTELKMFSTDSVDEIISVNLIDHFRVQDLPNAFREWHRILKPGGLLVIDVGNIVENSKLLLAATTKEEFEWALRLIYCHARDKYDIHHWGYTPDYLRSLIEPIGFKFEWESKDYIVHDVYPNFQICLRKISPG